ncbi:MAG: hypothetical protein CVU42_16985 [Chloroflexi bacterium HGW-Chloroflexi-4]|nr:MAG: hypothetical protein CVU42_16985 [Chloroflexi bacterium HGW-Chloroflexi-4]
MNRLKKLVFTSVLVVLLIVGLSCSVVPQGIQGLFASKTPTPTNTATATPTPTVTATPTKTPIPPIKVNLCAFQEECSDALPIRDLISADDETQALNAVTFVYTEPLFLSVGWVVKDQTILEDNLKYIKWFFKIDGQDYFREDWLSLGETVFDDDPSNVYPGMWFGTVMDGWKVGERHTVEIGYIFDATLSDGWDTYYRGTIYQARYLLIPMEKPTATPTATATRTNTPRPTAIPYTKTPKATLAPTQPPCDINSSIEIDNSTGGIVRIDLSGPMKFHFDLPTGHTSMKVCPGSYSYKAWGCGGASDSGTLNTGETHEFYCY